MRILTKALFLFLITTVAFPQKTLTLDDAINIALQKNSTLQKSMNTLKTYESGLLASYGNLLPSLSASGSWSWNRNEDEGTTYNYAGFVYTSPASKTESRSYRANVDANWTLFDGLANIAGVSKSKSDLEAARLSLERLKQDIVFQTISFYYDVINTSELLKVKVDDVRQAQKNLETITERNKLGAVTLADVYAQQVTLGNAELEEIRTRNTLETAKTNLLYYLGLDVFDNYSFSDNFSVNQLDIIKNRLSEESDSLSVLVSSAMDNRFDYKSALLNLEGAYDDITIARSGHFPRLTNSLGFSSNANSFDKLFASKSYTVGLTLSIPIFSGFSVSNRVEIATVNAKNQEVVVSDLEREIKRNLQKTFLDLQAAEKSLSVSEKNVESAEENLKIEQEKYSLGSSKLLDVLTARTNYTNARVAYINAEYAYVVLSEQLKYYTGVLDYKKYERTGDN
jgi:outer membrane protein